MSIEKIRANNSELTERVALIAESIKSINTQQGRAKPRLEHLEKELPLLLAGEFLGEVPTEKVQEVKAEIARLRQFLADAPITIQGFQSMKSDIAGQHARNLNTLARLRAVESYNEALAALQKQAEAGTWDRDAEGDLFTAAADLGKRAEAEAFVQRMKAIYEAGGRGGRG